MGWRRVCYLCMCQQARVRLGLQGFVPVGGHSVNGQALLQEARLIRSLMGQNQDVLAAQVKEELAE